MSDMIEFDRHVALSRRTGLVMSVAPMTFLPAPKRLAIHRAINRANSFAELPKEYQALIEQAEDFIQHPLKGEALLEFYERSLEPSSLKEGGRLDVH